VSEERVSHHLFMCPETK